MKVRHVLLAVFLLTNIIAIVVMNAGPFFDEGIYVVAGIRTLEGQGLADGYLTWFAGSLVWPVMAGVSFNLGGFIATRILATIMVMLGILGSVEATKNFFGERAANWTIAAFLVSGPIMALAHLGSYDIPAFAGTGVSLWLVSLTAVKDDRKWLVLAAPVFVLTVFSKYPLLANALPLAAVLVVTRRKKAIMDISILGFICGGLFLAIFLPFREQIGQLFDTTWGNRPTFGVQLPVIIFAVITLSIPTWLAILGVVTSDKHHRMLTLVLWSAGLIWPVYHVLRSEPVGDWKHISNGFLFVYPVLGLLLARWRSREPLTALLLVFLVCLGWYQVSNLDNAHPDVRPGTQYLVEHVETGEHLLINNSWSYLPYLYPDVLTSPWDVWDAYRIEQAQAEKAPAICSFDWFVDEKGSYEWPQSITDQVERCGFVPLFTFLSSQRGLAPDFRYHTAQVVTTIWGRKD